MSHTTISLYLDTTTDPENSAGWILDDQPVSVASAIAAAPERHHEIILRTMVALDKDFQGDTCVGRQTLKAELAAVAPKCAEILR